MSTTYTSSTKDASSSKDKDTDTYVRSGDNSAESSKLASGGGKGKFSTDTDKTSELEGKTGQQYGLTSAGLYSGTQRPYGHQQQQDGDHQQQQGGSSSRGSQSTNQQEVQQKLREVGNLLQKAGQLLQDLQGSSGDIQASSFQRGHGGNYQGPYGGFEAHPQSGQYGQSSQYGQAGQYGGSQFGFSSGQLGGQHLGQNASRYYESERPQFGGQFDNREDRYSGRSYNPLGRFDDRFESRQERGNVDRFGGFGGPNRPDLAYGQQYGVQGSYGSEGRRGGDFEFGSGRRNVERW